MKAGSFSGKGLKILLHVTVWVIVFLIPAFILTLDSGGDDHFYYVVIAQSIANIILFYANYFWLVPKLFLNGKKVLFFIIIIFTAVGFSFAIEESDKLFRTRPQHPDDNDKMLIVEFTDSGDTLVYEDPYPPKEIHKRGPPTKKWPVYNSILISFLICGFSIGLRLSDQMLKKEKQRKEAEKEKLNSELMLLKNQVSPHFFFNTLNNIYSLTQSSVEDAQNAILRLSRLMRYMLYDSDDQYINISREIEFMNNYIDLMKLRISPKVELKITFPEQYPDILMPPLLFIPFIENAFKHGISYNEPSFIRLSLEVSKEEIFFTCSNSVNTPKNGIDTMKSGIGLDNVKRRLNLLYPGSFNLTINDADCLYVVILKISLNHNKC